jgi:hypothetical protein
VSRFAVVPRSCRTRKRVSTRPTLFPVAQATTGSSSDDSPFTCARSARYHARPSGETTGVRMLDDGTLFTGIGVALVMAPLGLLALGAALCWGEPPEDTPRRTAPRRRSRDRAGGTGGLRRAADSRREGGA